MPEFLVSTSDVYNQAIKDEFSLINIQNIHFARYSQIELFESHKDPFDRLLIATAIEENATILSGDEKFKLYDEVVKVIW
ncbi:PIN domain-containing protein [Mucilaginibacter psychrotolerans]|uniref:PIN domain-containing protein n=1 Tax=Mucilaginibacter psychrotolerans TaxID=1524096 RepID=A0A4Y8SMY5_9SPHI|nr:PIN domain-containing protein [Mucilaginibacter psychrotolerans]TFF40222.1 PIN domain-containing protein [Mucilaginibacter psychrotolerans]